jgi:hypothetical protein
MAFMIFKNKNFYEIKNKNLIILVRTGRDLSVQNLEEKKILKKKMRPVRTES